MARPKLIYVVTEDWYFLSHRMPTVHGAQAAGYEVCVITSDGQCRKAIEAQGVRVIPFNFERRNLNPARASRQISELRDIYSREKPSVVHHIAMKPILYGSVAAWMTGVPHVVNAFAGLAMSFPRTRSWHARSAVSGAGVPHVAEAPRFGRYAAKSG
jgi:hypothetical protein